MIVEGSYGHYHNCQDGRKRKVDDKENVQKGNKFKKFNKSEKVKGGNKIRRNEDDIEFGSNGCKYCVKKHGSVCTKRSNTCFNCRLVGHLVIACKKPQTNYCFKYGKEGHFAKECPQNEEKTYEEKELKDQLERMQGTGPLFALLTCLYTIRLKWMMS